VYGWTLRPALLVRLRVRGVDLTTWNRNVKQLLYTSQLSGTYHQFFAASYLNKFTFHIAITHACHQNGHQNDILRPISVQHIVMWSLDVTFLSQKYIIIHKRH